LIFNLNIRSQYENGAFLTEISEILSCHGAVDLMGFKPNP